ncbi:MAG: hypothetical protein JWP10_1934 [Nocardioidaceae bacterium]|nr:hypothetical protein [Nocardioidaceae bacterium]
MAIFLNRDQEHALAVRAAHGDREAADALVLAHLPLVASEVRRRSVPGGLRDDALQAGALGLSKAVVRFDPTRGTRFSAYAWSWVRREIDRSDGQGNNPFAGDLADQPDPGEAKDSAEPAITSLVSLLEPALRDVVFLRFGWGSTCGFPLSTRAVAQRLGLSVSQVRTREAKAIGELRGRLANVGGRAPLGGDPL